MAWILDIILIAVVIIGVIAGYKKGFVHVLLGFLGLFIAFVLAFTLSSPVAELCYDSFAAKPLGETVSSAVSEIAADTSQTAVDQLFEQNATLSGLVSIVGITPESVVEMIPDDAAAAVLTDILMANVVKPAAVFIIRALVMILLFILLYIIIRLISRPVGKFFRKLALIGPVNAVLGAVLGLLKGGMWAAFIAAVIYVLLVITGGFIGITKDTLQDTFFVRFVLNLLNWQV